MLMLSNLSMLFKFKAFHYCLVLINLLICLINIVLWIKIFLKSDLVSQVLYNSTITGDWLEIPLEKKVESSCVQGLQRKWCFGKILWRNYMGQQRINVRSLKQKDISWKIENNWKMSSVSRIWKGRTCWLVYSSLYEKGNHYGHLEGLILPHIKI